MNPRTLIAALLAGLSVAGCQWGERAAISGSVNLDPALLGKAQNPGAVLFIVARNPGDIPVAVKEIVTPDFPCRFTIGKEDLILPDAWNGDLKVTAHLATRMGPDGLPVPEAGETLAVAAPNDGGPTDLRLYIPAPKARSWATARVPTPATATP